MTNELPSLHHLQKNEELPDFPTALNERGTNQRRNFQILSKKILALFIFLAFLLITGVSVYLVKQSQDLRQQASQDTGLVEVQVENVTPTDQLLVNQPLHFGIFANTQSLQTDGFQLVFELSSPTLLENPTLSLTETSLQVGYQKIEKINNTYKVAFIFLPPGIQQSYSSTTSVKIGEISLTPTETGTIAFSFDDANSFSTRHASSPPDDQLKTLTDVQFTVLPIPASPSPTPTSTPVATPTATPSPSPTATPQVTPTPSPTPASGIGGISSTTPTPVPTPTPTPVASCGTSCKENRECLSSLICFNGVCKNPSCVNAQSCTCATPTPTPTPTPSVSANISTSSQKTPSPTPKSVAQNLEGSTLTPSAPSASPTALKNTQRTISPSQKTNADLQNETGTKKSSFFSPTLWMTLLGSVIFLAIVGGILTKLRRKNAEPIIPLQKITEESDGSDQR